VDRVKTAANFLRLMSGTAPQQARSHQFDHAYYYDVIKFLLCWIGTSWLAVNARRGWSQWRGAGCGTDFLISWVSLQNRDSWQLLQYWWCQLQYSFIIIVNCGIPLPPVNGTLSEYLSISENATVSFQCNEGYMPSLVQNTTCTSESWIPNPAKHNCTLGKLC
jgi:hypothetical protein